PRRRATRNRPEANAVGTTTCPSTCPSVRPVATTRSAPQEEAPSPDEKVPPQPEPGREQHPPAGRRSRDLPEHLGQRRPLVARVEQADRLPGEERADDDGVADDRDHPAPSGSFVGSGV